MASQASNQPGSDFPGWSRYQADVVDTFNQYNGTFTTHTDFYDDMGWWALTWLNAYNYFLNPDYLTTAENIADYIHANAVEDDSGGTNPCGPGALRQKAATGANVDAITNELFFELTARLHRTLGTDDTGNKYLNWATSEWNIIKDNFIVEVGPQTNPPTVATAADLANPNSHLLVADNLSNQFTSGCKPTAGQKWSYNQGVILGALHAMYKITGDTSYLTPAEAIANTVENDVQSSVNQPAGTYSNPALVDSAHSLSQNNTLSEACLPQSGDDWPDGCDVTGPNNWFLQFKGIFIRNLDCLNQDVAGSPSYGTFISNNANAVFTLDQNTTTDFSAGADLNLFGFVWDDNGNSWPGTETRELNEATQGSALDALVANMSGTPSWC